VITVTAIDRDVEAPNNVVRYSMQGLGPAANYFTIDSNTGLISVAKDLRDIYDTEVLV
jgi:hypothetical protein